MVRFGRILPLVLCFAASRADADPETSPITDSNYAIELYDGVAIGNTAVVGMGGATVALAIGTSGTLFNPSAPAVKPTTDTDTWSWDYHLDYLNGSLSTDYDNNGFISETGTSVLTLGFGLRFGEWAGAITATAQYAPVDAMYTLPSGNMVPLTATGLRVQFALARWIKRIDTAIGISSQAARFSLAPDCTDEECGDLFTVSGGGLELGATWAPRRQSFRIGAALGSPIAGGDITSNCDPMDCVGWILPEKVVSPWRLAVGGAYRFSGSDWNQLVGGYFRDERSLTLAADVVITGSSENAYGLEAFGNHELQRSGRHPSFSVRGGAEYEWLPGRLRLRGGSYWEPGRFVGVSGRLHGTFGVEVRVFQFWFWGSQRRGRISLTTDFAANYRNGGLSVGFWH
jgi:hypothetical protein